MKSYWTPDQKNKFFIGFLFGAVYMLILFAIVH